MPEYPKIRSIIHRFIPCDAILEIASRHSIFSSQPWTFPLSGRISVPVASVGFATKSASQERKHRFDEHRWKRISRGEGVP